MYKSLTQRKTERTILNNENWKNTPIFCFSFVLLVSSVKVDPCELFRNVARDRKSAPKFHLVLHTVLKNLQ